jgi:hypothetical protein
VVDASEGGYPSDLQHARLPNLVYANKHMHTKVHESVKRECEQLAGLVVSHFCKIIFMLGHFGF